MHCCAKGACDSAACTVRMCAMRATVHCALTMRRLRQLWHQAPCSRCNVDQINFRQTTCKFTWPKVMMACSVMCRSLLGAIHCTAAAAGLPASDPLNASTRTAVLRLKAMRGCLELCVRVPAHGLPRLRPSMLARVKTQPVVHERALISQHKHVRASALLQVADLTQAATAALTAAARRGKKTLRTNTARLMPYVHHIV